MPTVDEVIHLVQTANWQAASQAFGSSHSALIGLMVEAWARLGEDRFALEGAPKVAGFKSDAILTIGIKAVGVVEVEGTKILDRIRRFSRYFCSDHLCRTAFGLVVAYQSALGGQCVYPRTTAEGILAAALDVANSYPHNPLAVVLAEKRYQPLNHLDPAIPLRRGYEWAWGVFARIAACVFHQGNRIDLPLWPAARQA